MPGITYKISGDNSQFQKDVNESQNIAQGGFNKISALGIAAWAAVGAAVIKATKAGVDFLKDSVNTGMAFDKSMAQVAATMGVTVDEIGDLRNFAQEMGAATAFSATQAADALNYMALAGYDAKTSMDMLPNVLNLAAAGGIELARASDMVTDAQSALGLTLPQTSDLVDKMAKASSKSNTSVAQLGDAILTVGGTAKVMSGGTTELSMALGVLADNGIKGAEGGTALRNVLLAFTAPTQKASNLMKELGFEAFDLDGNLRPIPDIFEDLNSAMDGMTDKQRSEILSTIFHKADLKSANALLATSRKRFDELSTAIDGAWYTATGLNNALDNIGFDPSKVNFDELTRSFEKFGISAEDVQYALDVCNGNAEDFAETLLEVADTGTTIDDIYSALPIDIDELQMAFDGAAGAAQAMADTQLDNLAGDITLAESAAEGLKISISDRLTPTLRDFVKKGTTELGKLKAAFDTGGFKGLAKQLGASLSDMIGEFGKRLPDVVDTALEFGKTFVTNLARSISSNSGNILRSGADLLSKIGKAIKDGVPELGRMIGTLLSEAIINAPEILLGVLDFITSIVEGIFNGLLEGWVSLWTNIGDYMNGTKKKTADEIKGSFSKPIRQESEEVRTYLEEMNAHIETARKNIASIPQGVKDADADFKLAQEWIKIVEELGGKTTLTAGEQAKLKIAIEKLNEILPETARIVEGENGQWKYNIDLIKESITQINNRAKAQAYEEYLVGLHKQIIEAEQDRLDLESKLQQKAKEQELINYQIKKYGEFQGDVATALGKVNDKILEGKSRTTAYREAWDSLPVPVRAFANQVGISTDDCEKAFYDLSGAIDKTLFGERQYDKNGNVIGTIGGLHNQLGETKEDIKGLEGAIKDTNNVIADSSRKIEDTSNKLGLLSSTISKEDFNKVYKPVTDALKNVASKFSSVKDAAYSGGYDSGKAFDDGMTAGIKENQKPTLEQAQALADKVKQKIKDALKINSPSKVTKEIGKGIPEGLALGIADTEEVRGVERAARTTAEAGIYALTSSIDTSITASPVVIGGDSGMGEVISLMKQYLPEIGADIVLDTGELVGHTISNTDAELGELQRRRLRYE